MKHSAIIFVFALLAATFSTANADDIYFTHIGEKEGLSQSTVLDIEQDTKGNMWFATYNGLNRYDGYTFTVFRHDDTDSTSIASDIIRTVTMDDGGRIWAGTYSGLSLYDRNTERFRNFSILCSGRHISVDHIAAMDNDRLLLGTSSGLKIFDIRKNQFAVPESFPDLSRDEITAMTGNMDMIFIGTKKGRLIKINADGTAAEEMHVPFFKGNRVQALFIGKSSVLWAGTEGYGLFRIDLEDRTFRHFSTRTHKISSDYIRSICPDPDGNLWIGTFTSLNVLDPVSETFKTYESDPVQPGSLSQSSVRAIYKDSQGGMWLGTYFGGINYWHPLTRRFSSISNIPYKNSLNDNIVSCIAEDKDGIIWIGTNSGGVNRYDPATGRFSFYTMADGLGANDIKSLYIDEHHVYAGMHHGGLGIISKDSGYIENYAEKGGNVYSVLPYKDGNLLLGMVNGNIYRFSLKDHSYHPIIDTGTGEPVSTGKLVTMKSDSQGRIWTGTETGVKIFSMNEDKATPASIVLHLKKLDATFVNCIYETNDRKFWIGTRNGLYCFDEREKKLAHYTIRDGLPGNVICGILEDGKGRLWISTGNGLSCFEPEKRLFKNYVSSDGLPGNQFNISSCCRTADGKMYFGGIDGISVFEPDKMPENHFIPPANITGLYVANSMVMPDDGTGILSRHIGNTSSIRLKEGNSSFTLTFSVPDYVSWKENRFAYKLEGFDDQWRIVSDPIRAATYSNLEPGKYRFLVTAANKDGIWNEKPAGLDIIVRPHWYNTAWSRLVLLCIVLALAYITARYLWIRKRMKMQLAFEKVDKERIREVNEMKIRFFINMSHEIRTPLTMISAPLQELLTRVKDKWELRRLKYMEKSTDRLLYLVNQLMDYRRAEMGVFHLKVRKTKLQPLLEKIFGYYTEAAESEKIDYGIESTLGEKEICFDCRYIEMILNNLLSNAFKYTSRGQSITLSAYIEDDRCILKVKDTGTGISQEKAEHIFERFYQSDSGHVGSGIGLALVKNLAELHHGGVSVDSAPGKGSCFTVWFPAEASAYRPHEVENDDEEAVYSSNPASVHVRSIMDDRDAADNSGGGSAENETGGIAAMAAPETGSAGQKPKVMVVEDDRDIREYLSAGLSEEFDVAAAENGQEAVEMMKKRLPDIILSDVMMPVMDGVKLCRTVKQNIETSHIPVIMLSAKSDIKWQMEGLGAGADDYIPKPFSLAIVTGKIRNMMRTRLSAIRHFAESAEVAPEKIALNKLDEEFLKKAVAAVEAHLDDCAFSADMFAEAMNMSRSNLHIKMKALTGSSSMDFIRKIRLSKACELLKDGRYSVAEVSDMVGYSSPAYFTTSFKKHFGCLPSEYK